MNPEQRYRRLLRWYPRAWREAHGEVLLGTALDAAEAEGRDRPRAAEAWSLRLSGLGQRLDARAALALSLTALALGLTSTILWFASWGGGAAVSTIAPLLSALIVPLLLTVAVCALLRHAHLLSPTTAMTAVLLATPAWALSFLARMSWSVGFDEADAGAAPSPLSQAFPWLFLAAWIIGAAASGVVIASGARGLPSTARIALALSSGLVLPPVLGLGTVSPFTPTAAALVVFIVATMRGERRRSSPEALRRGSASATLRRGAGIAAVISGVTGIAALAFAFFGSLLITSIDSTRAMQIGIAAGVLALLPLVLALTAALAARFPGRSRILWGGGALFAAGLTASAIPSLLVDTRSADPDLFASGIAGAGVGVIVFALLRLGTAARIGIGGAVAVSYTLLLGWLLALLLPFLAPVLAALVATWGLRDARSAPPAPPNAGPRPTPGTPIGVAGGR